jgi:protein-S-isoprenylcysteine O-methyltransferase Ste14
LRQRGGAVSDARRLGALELGLRRTPPGQGRRRHDRATPALIAVSLGAAIALTAGPYRWVRHPSYGGLLLIMIGFGLGTGNWLALVICAVLPLPVLARRIHVEEAELTGVLGNDYRAYQAQTKRLIPGLW